MHASPKPLSALDEILRFNAGRKEELLRIKYARMAENVFAFFRGVDHLYAMRWPLVRMRDVGPRILICGDLHLENFGAYQTDDGDFRYDINDFDEALVAPCGLDLVRCTTSILLAAEVWQIAAIQATGTALHFLESFGAALSAAAHSGQIGDVESGKGAGPIWELLGETALGEQTKLLDHHTELNKHGQRRILRSADKHPEIGEKKAAQIRDAVEQFARTAPTPEAFRVLDVTGRIMGIGSLGLRRYTVLVAGGGTPDTNRLLDIKEAAPSSLLRCADGPQPEFGGNDALRIVQAQRQLQSKPTTGLAAMDIDGSHYRMREMVPDENRSKLDHLQKKPEKLRAAVEVVGQLTAWSQMRGCNMKNSDARGALASWVDAGALDTLLASAVRCVDVTCQDYESFRAAYAEHVFDKTAGD